MPRPTPLQIGALAGLPGGGSLPDNIVQALMN